ncbi:hypothetical protein C3747_323g18 [Trypanosoma cruzi]|uniref:Uncharacterized protein n=1 Tax=Trypanosoma cruzi TaxID=5693 RepID=A0A2V2VD78_TRYCR|nr:hypothetical protein C3747_323g18 [Trypanosoma cruzi]
MYADDLSIIVKGSPGKTPFPLPTWFLKNCMRGVRKMAWPSTRQSVKPLGSRSPRIRSQIMIVKESGPGSGWMSNPSHDHGASRTTKLLCMDLDPRLTLNVAATKQCAATSQRISQLRCIAHKEAGPSPHDLRTFVIGYGAPKLRYGSELIWAVATDSAKNEMQKTYATLTRIVSGVPSTVDPESAL